MKSITILTVAITLALVVPQFMCQCDGNSSECLTDKQFRTLKEIIWSCSAGGNVRYVRRYKLCVFNFIRWINQSNQIGVWFKDHCAKVPENVYEGNVVEQNMQFCEEQIVQKGFDILITANDILLKQVLGCRGLMLTPKHRFVSDNKTQMLNYVMCVKKGIKHNIQAFHLFKQCPHRIQPGNTTLDAIAVCRQLLRDGQKKKGFWRSLYDVSTAESVFIIEIVAAFVSVCVLVLVVLREIFQSYKQHSKLAVTVGTNKEVTESPNDAHVYLYACTHAIKEEKDLD